MGDSLFYTVVIGLAIGIGLFGIAKCAATVDVKTDYQSCIYKCPSSFGGDFDDLECPRLCGELITSKELKSKENITKEKEG